MQLVRFALGIRFAAMAELPEREFARRVYEEIFSVLTLTELEGLQVYGGSDPLLQEPGTDSGPEVFLAVIMGGKIKTMRKVFNAIDADAAINMYLTNSSPYIENNRLARVEGLAYYGTIQKNGHVSGGDGTLDGLTVPKKRGKRSPVGKGIKLLVAPEDYTDELRSADAIKLVTIAARKHFQGVKLLPAPVNRGGRGFARALATACDGNSRTAQVSSPEGTEKLAAHYAVLQGKLAVIETAEAIPEGVYSEKASSRGVGELIRRALDEGLRSIVIGVHDGTLIDCGFGMACALGVKFFDAQGEALSGTLEELPRVNSADAEFLLPALREAKVIVADASGAQAAPSPVAAHFMEVLSCALGEGIERSAGAAWTVAAVTGAECSASYDTVLDAMGFDKLLKGVALVVTGGMSPDVGDPVNSIIKRARACNIPVAVIAGGAGEEETFSAFDGAGLIRFDATGTQEEQHRSFSLASDSMFRLLRIGRDVEKIGAPKKPRQKSFVRLQIESWKEKRSN